MNARERREWLSAKKLQLDETIDKIKAIAPRDWNDEFLTLIAAQDLNWVGQQTAAGLLLRLND